MKKLLTGFIVCILLAQQLRAQLPEDALRISWTAPSGTARQQAIGGAMGSLGGEISSVFVNPAGLAFYRTGDFILSPGFHFISDKANYRGTVSPGNAANNFNIGTTGVVYGEIQDNGKTSSGAIAINRTANFGGYLHYKGQNNYSSYSEQYAEEFANSGLDINTAIFTPQLSYGTRMALYSYLIDTATRNGQPQVISLPLGAGLLNQENTISTQGGITEIALSYATTLNDKWYIGGTLGVPIINYKRTQTFMETDATGNANNDFASSTYNEVYTSNGYGLNAKLGVIYKPITSWRIGLAVHSPTQYGLKDNISANMKTNTENYAHEISISSNALDQMSDSSGSSIAYDLLTPWKFLISGSYLFHETEDIAKQRGFITADIGYSTTRTSHFSPEHNSNIDPSYFNGVNSVVKSIYKGIFDFRLGAELKFNTIMVRGGISYYTNPYKGGELKADRLYLTGGLGYRNKGMFIDLTYVQGYTKDVNFPYRLADKANTYATVKETSGTILVTVGFKFM